MVGRRVGSDQKDEVGVIEILQLNGRRSGAEALRQTDPRCLMAIIGAAVNIVGAEHTGEQLQDESRFIGGSTAGIKEGAICGGCLQLVYHAIQCFLPRDSPVMSVARFT